MGDQEWDQAACLLLLEWVRVDPVAWVQALKRDL